MSARASMNPMHLPTAVPVMFPRATVRERVVTVVRRVVSLALMLCAFAGVAHAFVGSQILFARGTAVPRPVQEFAWRVIETRCNYLAYEREQRSFFAYAEKVEKTGTG